MSKRKIKLLSENEIRDLYSLPKFNADERRLYFSLNESELKSLKQIRTVKAKLYFILQLGYFKAAHQFFKFSLNDVIKDTKYVLKTYFNKDYESLSPDDLYRETITDHRMVILTLLGYKHCRGHILKEMERHLLFLIKRFPKPRNMVRELIRYCENNRIILPSYRRLQDLYSKTYAQETYRIAAILNTMSDGAVKTIDRLIHGEGKDNIISINDVRHDPRNFKYKEVTHQLEKAITIKGLYIFTKTILPTLDLSNNAIEYYASIVEQYATYRLKQINKVYQHLYTLCFIYQRYRIFCNNLVTSFIYHVQSIVSDVKELADKKLLQYFKKLDDKLDQAADFIEWFPDQENKGLESSQLFEKSFEILPKASFSEVADSMKGKNKFDKEKVKWEEYRKKKRLFALYLRPIIKFLDIEHYLPNSNIASLIDIVKKHYSQYPYSRQVKLTDDLKNCYQKGIIIT